MISHFPIISRSSLSFFTLLKPCTLSSRHSFFTHSLVYPTFSSLITSPIPGWKSSPRSEHSLVSLVICTLFNHCTLSALCELKHLREMAVIHSNTDMISRIWRRGRGDQVMKRINDNRDSTGKNYTTHSKLIHLIETIDNDQMLVD